VNYLLSVLELTKQNVLQVMFPNQQGMTCIDMAGKHKSNEVAVLILRHLCKNQDVIKEIFQVVTKKN